MRVTSHSKGANEYPDPPFEADHWCARRRHQHREHHPTYRLRPAKERPAVDKHDTAVERISETLAEKFLGHDRCALANINRTSSCRIDQRCTASAAGQ